MTGFPRLRYNKDRPFTKKVTYYNYFIPSDSITIPEAYVVKKGWTDVIELMELNHIDFTTLEKDTLLIVESYKIKEYDTRPSPYEGHYQHFNTKVSKTKGAVKLSAGDYVIPTNQPGIRYILETLEPTATDSFFNWNFFDTVLQQKEGFSPYVFEDIASDMLQKDTALHQEFLYKKEIDSAFAKNWYSQLDWLYKRSPNYEAAHMQYPVYRIPK